MPRKAKNYNDNFLLEVSLEPAYINSPRIRRTLSVPPESTFETFHKALQIAFGWSSQAQYEFRIKTSLREIPMLLIADEEVTKAYEAATQPDDNQGAIEYRDPRMTVRDVVGDKEYWRRSTECLYVYDAPGEHWKHTIKRLSRDEDEDHNGKGRFFVVEGSGHPMAEGLLTDGRNIGSWEELKEAYKFDDPNEREKAWRVWYQNVCKNGDPKGLGEDRVDEWEIDDIHSKLASLSI